MKTDASDLCRTFSGGSESVTADGRFSGSSVAVERAQVGGIRSFACFVRRYGQLQPVNKRIRGHASFKACVAYFALYKSADNLLACNSKSISDQELSNGYIHIAQEWVDPHCCASEVEPAQQAT